MRHATCICLITVAACSAAIADTVPTNLYNFSVYSQSDVQLQWKADVTGNVAAWDDVQLADQSDVHGNICAGDKVSLGWKASAGDIYDRLGKDAFAAHDWPTLYDSRSHASDVSVADKKSLTLAPGSYGDLKVNWKGSLVLTAGTYNFDSIELGDMSDVTLDTSMGDILVCSAGETKLKWKTKVVRKGDGGAVFTSAGKVSLDEARLSATVLSKDEVELGWKSQVDGQIFANKNIKIGEEAKVGGQSFGSVPEPSTLVLLIGGGFGMVLRRRK